MFDILIELFNYVVFFKTLLQKLSYWKCEGK